MSPITKAIKIIGLQPLASACGVTYQAVKLWEKKGRLPRTEYTGETGYSNVIEKLSHGCVTRNELLSLLAHNKDK